MAENSRKRVLGSTNNNKRTFQKFRPVTYIGTLTTTNGSSAAPFQDILNALYELCSIDETIGLDMARFIDSILYQSTDDNADVCSIDEILERFIKQAANMVPKLEGKNNIHTRYSVASNKISVRLEDNIGISVVMHYDVVDGQATVDAATATITFYRYRKNAFNALKNSAFWEKKHSVNSKRDSVDEVYEGEDVHTEEEDERLVEY